MKTKIKLKLAIAMMIALRLSNAFAQNQNRPSMAVLNIQSTGVIPDAQNVGRMVRLEMEKTNTHDLIDMFDASDILKKNNFDISTCFGKNCVLDAGKLLKVDKMLTGNVERSGEKIAITLKIINVQNGEIEKSNTEEYLNLQTEIQKMIEISVKRLVGIEPDPLLVSQLINYNQPIDAPQTHILLTGPRMGVSYTTGSAGERLKAPIDQGGFDMYPCNIQIGWQHEIQYLSSGNFQGLFEFIGQIGGLESGKFIPSVTVLNGLRFGKQGWEFGMGPSFRFLTKADGYYDDKGDWHLKGEYIASDNPLATPPTIVSRLDSRGSPTLSVGLVLAIGRTFKSGYLNMPVNLYVSPRKEGWIAGLSFGFNIHRKAKVED